MRYRSRVLGWSLFTVGSAALIAGGIVGPGFAPSVRACCGGGAASETAFAGSCGDGAGGECCGRDRSGRSQAGRRQQQRGPGRADRQDIHALMSQRGTIERHVEEIEGGVVTTTTSSDPEVVRVLRQHVRRMQTRMADGDGIRLWDPLFMELFRRHAEVEMTVEDIPGGVRVRQTSEDVGVVSLVRQHAVHGVSEFIAEGCARAHEPTPFPDGYGDAPSSARMAGEAAGLDPTE